MTPRLLIAVTTLLLGGRLLAAEPARPNIILIYSDDHGFADLGVQGSVDDIKTPNIDAMARAGVRFSRGYVSAPQCVPSRAGVITGRYQQRFGVEDNLMGPLPLEELTIAERLKPAGYVSCQVGKWHLEPSPKRAAEVPQPGRQFLPLNQGFDEYYTGPMSSFVASHDLKGNKLPDAPKTLTDERFRCLWQTDAAVSFIDRRQREPFFLYLAYYTPHVPLASVEPWFSKTSAAAPLERRQALSMIAAMDDGVGRIRQKLRDAGIEKNTLIFFISDNGAPLKKGAWNGSLNVPLVGEKGMLTDGGVRTPFVAEWPGTLPAGVVYDRPVINLDVAATAVAVAGLPNDPKLDGVNLLPFITGQNKADPHDFLFWRWRSQAAIRGPRYKLILLGKSEKFLFDMNSPEAESRNLIEDLPEVAADVEKRLMAWDATLPPPGLPRDVVGQDQQFYDDHVNSRADDPMTRSATPHDARRPGRGNPASNAGDAATVQGWVARGGTLTAGADALTITPEKGSKRTFIACPNLAVNGPATAKIAIRSAAGGQVGISWRLKGQADFVTGQTASVDLKQVDDWQNVSIPLPAEDQIIHVRILLPAGASEIRSIELEPKDGKPGKSWRFVAGKSE